jgi:hypothetical protein
MKKFWILRCIKIALLVVLGVFVLGWVVMSLWNWLIPALFNGPVINFFQALGILVLSKILFGGFKKGGHHHCGHCGKGGHYSWKQRFAERMSQMSPEQKEKIKQKMKQKLGNKCMNWFDEEPEPENIKKEDSSQ